MAAGDTTITLVGNLVEDPELRYTPGLPRRRPGSAENVTESLTKGTRVIVQGRLKQRSYEAKDGSGKRTVYEVEADEIGPSLRNAAAKVVKSARSKDGQGGAQRSGGPAADDPWASKSDSFSDEPPF